MPINPLIALQVKNPEIQSYSDSLAKQAAIQEAQSRNKLYNRKFQALDAESERQNKLAGLMQQFTKGGTTDYQALRQGLAESGLGSEIQAIDEQQYSQQKEQRLAAKDQLEGALDKIKTTRDIVRTGDQTNWDSTILPQLQQIYGDAIPEQLRTFNPQVIKSAVDQSMTVEQDLTNKWRENQAAIQQHEKELDRQLTREGQQASAAKEERNYDQRERLGANGKALPIAAIDKITKTQGNMETASRLVNTFKDDFAGKTITGELGNVTGRLFGDSSGQSQWWQDYQSVKNEVRNDLFGSALTPGEMQEWEKAAINPRMSPDEIKKNLARQKQIEETGYKRKLENFKKGGYDIGGFEQDLQQPNNTGFNGNTGDFGAPTQQDTPAGWNDTFEAEYQRMIGGQ